MQKKYLNDEVSIQELFKIIWQKKWFVISFTLLLTILTFLYLNTKKPIYEVKSVVRIGYIGSSLVEKINVIEKSLRLIFNVDNSPKISDNEAIVSNISAIKKVDNFIEITTQGLSNEMALKKNKEVIDYLKNRYEFKIDEFNLKVKLNIKNMEEQKNYIENVVKVEKEEQIKMLNKVDLVMIMNKLKFNEEKQVEYQNAINQILKRKRSDNTQNVLSAIEISNYQNLMLTSKNQIENLNKEREYIINEKIPVLKRSIEFEIKNKIDTLNDKIGLEKLKLANNVAKNSELIGKIQFSNNPVKPKKLFSIISSFIIGLVLSFILIFFVRFINFIRLEQVK